MSTRAAQPEDSRQAPTAGYLRIDAVSKSFAAKSGEKLVLDNITLGVNQGEFLAIVGPSGCGKSTLLQIIAGLLAPSAGQVRVDNRLVSAPPENMVYLFQQYTKSLFPWRTALDNVGFAVEHRPGMWRRKVRTHAKAFLDLVGLGGYEAHYPWQLSGGMQQRVAIARALAAEPRVLLLDEPFSSVDALTRIELQSLTLDLWEKHRLTVVLVTHDVDEALFLSDRVAVLSSQPGVVSRIFWTGLPRPRDSITTRESPRFLQLRHELLNILLGRRERD